ncbi:8-oxo-dGTP diphosphatase [Blautia glucerasea]|uniref:NUDIX hydrolase n=1 Tax=Blautia glucerasea TaxID=536633 RepID=UPI001D033D33|nr:8-oxo-dGTP diphosphatase [Blautia glucerasea]MCB5388406.1 8-oxo-dGTP diphosphatase [Blautia glucerasea]MCB5422790.1 8-oxo-dGTP diphosphatase [Blautia luti]
MTITTLCYIENNNQYLMLHRTKKPNDINEGKWIGVGGHVERDESPEECLVREVREETGLTLTAYKFRGLVTFVNNKCESELMCVFTADGYTGELITCNEGELRWVDKTQVPNLPTWEGDRVFLDLLLSNEERFFSIKLQYEGDQLVKKKINLY